MPRFPQGRTQALGSLDGAHHSLVFEPIASFQRPKSRADGIVSILEALPIPSGSRLRHKHGIAN